MFGRKRYDPPPPPVVDEELPPSKPLRPAEPVRSERTPEIMITSINAQITGAIELNDDHSFRISGEVEGDLTCDAVEIVESGSMKGSLVANWVTIAGNFSGNIKTNELTVATTAIVIEPNADFKGQLTRPSDEQSEGASAEDEPEEIPNATPSIAEKAEMESAGSATNGDGPTTPPPPTPLFGGSTRPTSEANESDEENSAPPRSPFSTSGPGLSATTTQNTGSPDRPQPGPPVSPFLRPDSDN
jgi:cytoskeletal protein CcmA (bactofilin family)